MDKIMEVYIAKASYSPASEAHAMLSLPAMPFELFDALDKARVMQGDELYFEVSDYYAFEYMAPYIADSANLLELNALCQKLSELNEGQATAFEGLLNMEIAKREGPIAVGKLIDLAYSTDCCHVVSEALNDSQLGRFYAENGFVPATDGISDELFEMLDFESIGKEMRRGEGGVFTEHGYVVQHSDLNEVHANMDFHIHTPFYQILLELPDGSQLALPSNNLPEASSHHCVDCRVPQLMAAIDIAELNDINAFAELLESMGDRTMRKYKAVLHATGCDSLEAGTTLAEHLAEYTLDSKVSSFAELGRAEIEFLLGNNDVGLLSQYTNLYGYGQALMERDGSVITNYGLLVRQDHQPMQTPLVQEASGGMEMT